VPALNHRGCRNDDELRCRPFTAMFAYICAFSRWPGFESTTRTLRVSDTGSTASECCRWAMQRETGIAIDGDVGLLAGVNRALIRAVEGRPITQTESMLAMVAMAVALSQRALQFAGAGPHIEDIARDGRRDRDDVRSVVFAEAQQVQSLAGPLQLRVVGIVQAPSGHRSRAAHHVVLQQFLRVDSTGDLRDRFNLRFSKSNAPEPRRCSAVCRSSAPDGLPARQNAEREHRR